MEPTLEPTTPTTPTIRPSTSPIASPTVGPTPEPITTPQPSAEPTFAWQPCIEDFVLSTSGDATDADAGSLSIEMDATLQKLRITLSGPSAKWFGIGFGSHLMSNTYAMTVSGNAGVDNMELVERVLGEHLSGGVVSANVVAESQSDDGVQRTVVIVLDWNGVFDFTDFFVCNLRTLPIIWARGLDFNFGYHGANKNNVIELLSCVCEESTDSPTTVSPTAADTTTPSPTTPSPTTLPPSAAPTDAVLDDGDNAPQLSANFMLLLFSVFVVSLFC